MKAVIRLRFVLLALIAASFLAGAALAYREVHGLQRLDTRDAEALVAWHAAESEREYWRLMATLKDMRNDLSPTTSVAVRRRIEVFWSRLLLLIEGNVGTRLNRIPGFHARIQGIIQELATLEPMLESVTAAGGAEYWTLREHLERLGPVLHGLLLDASHADTRWVLRRKEALNHALLTLGFAVVGGFLSGLLLIGLLFWEHRRAEFHARTALDERQRLKDVLEASSDWMWETDVEGRFSFLSQRAAEVLGVAPSDILGKRRERLAAPDEDPEKWRRHRAVLAEHRPFRDFRYHIQLGGRPSRYISVSGAPFFDSRGRFVGYRGAARDMSAARRAAAALSRSEAHLRALVENSPAGIFEIDLDGRILSVNSEATRLLGVESSEILRDQPYCDWVAAADQSGVETAIQATGAGERRELRCVLAPGNGETRVADLSFVPLSDLAGQRVVRLMVLARDVSNEQRLILELGQRASHDPLTGLLNRRALEQRLTIAIDATRRDSVEHVLCLIGLDHFKLLNDTLGHARGDEVLRRVAHLLAGKVRSGDTLARPGGDEFAVLMRDCSLNDGLQSASILLRTLDEHTFTDMDGGASIGVVRVDEGAGDAGQVLCAADSACYAAKRAGRNRIHLYRSDDQDWLAREREELAWVERIHTALAEDGFVLYAQDILRLDLDSGSTDQFGYEVLLRMRGVDGEILSPGAFLPVAERHGLAGDIDRWVVVHTLAWLARNPRHVERLVKCSINLSGGSAGCRDFVRFLLGAVADTGALARKLCFELTETAAVLDIDQVVSLMNELHEFGCTTCIDDFGTGLSSFAYLKTLPTDVLKIDGVFIRGLASDPRNRAIVRSINEVAHSLGKKTVAEFVEDTVCLEAVRAIGIDYAQGYAIAKPRPLAELADGAAAGVTTGAVTQTGVELRLIEDQRSA